MRVKSLFFTYENTYFEKIQEKAIFAYCENLQMKVCNIYINIFYIIFSPMIQLQKFFTYIIIYCDRTIVTKLLSFGSIFPLVLKAVYLHNSSCLKSYLLTDE